MAEVKGNRGHRHPSPDLCVTFQDESETVWRDLKCAQQFRVPRSEETITEDLLLNVQKAHPQEVSTFPFTKRKEGAIGADWEWWLTNGRQWVGLLIQAKKLDPKTNKYEKIVYKTQMQDLIQSARKKGISPLYFFYNFTKLPTKCLAWNCGSTPFDLAQLGCTVAHAAAVESVVNAGGEDLSSMSKILLPVKCLVCCKVLGGPDGSLPGRVNGVTNFLGGLIRSVGPDSRSIEPSQVRDKPPWYVERLQSTPEEERGAQFEELRDEVGPIGELVVIEQSFDE